MDIQLQTEIAIQRTVALTFSYLKRSLNFLKVLLHLWSHWELKILIRTLEARVIIPILEKLVGGYSTPHCVTVIGHRIWCWLSVAFLCWVSLCVCLVAQLCPTLCNPMIWSPPGSSVHGICQARLLEWVVMPPAFYFRVHFSCSSQDRC